MKQPLNTPTNAILESISDGVFTVDPPHGEPPAGADAALARAASAIYIDTPRYGTRCSTVLRLRSDGRAEFVERWHGDGGGQAEFRFFSTAQGNDP